MACIRQTHSLLFLLAVVAVGGCGHQRLRHVAVPEVDAPKRPPLSTEEKDNLRQSTEAAWLKRDDPLVLAKFIEDLETLYSQMPQDGALGARLSRAYFLMARHARMGHDRQKMLDSLARGVLVGERALVSLYPALQQSTDQTDPIGANLGLIDGRGMEALTWYVSNLGAYAASRGITSLIFYRDRVTAILERMLVVDPHYLYSTPHRYWAIFLSRAPAFAGGSLEQARVHFEQAMAKHPSFFANACDYAQFYAIQKGDRALFERLLQQVLKADSSGLADMAPEMRMEQQRARKLMDHVETLF